jgi:hypothetical protein
MVKKIVFVMVLAICLCGVTQANITNGDSIVVNFNSSSDVGDFLVIRDDTPSDAGLGIGQNAAKGIGATPSGGLEAINVGTVNASNDLAALYAPGGVAADGAISLNVGETLLMSMKYKVADNTKAATPRLGIASFSDAATATTNWTAFDIDGGKDIIGGTTAANWADGIAVNLATAGDKTFNIADVVGGGGGTLIPDPLGPYVLTDAAWYQFALEITKSTTADEFDVAATLNLLSADGTTLDSQIGYVTATITNAGLYADDVIAGLTIVHDADPATMTNDYDDLTISVIPEPATMTLLGLGALSLIRRRRK